MESVDWIHPAQDRDHLRAHVNNELLDSIWLGESLLPSE
jgi:hypothetical protein